MQPTDTNRIRFIDAGRGTAMLFVFLAHFSEVYLQMNGKTELLQFCYYMTMIASPTFMLISGMMLGYLYNTKSSNFGRIRRKYLDRGLFLITIAHVFIFIAFLPVLDQHGMTIKVTFVTDAIGISMIAGVLMIDKTKAHTRLLISTLIYGIGTFAAMMKKPGVPILASVNEAMYGSFYHKDFVDTFPILQWFSIYLAGSVVGERVGHFHLSGEFHKIRRLFLKLSLAGIIISSLLVIISKIWAQAESINLLLTLRQKNPPGLLYFSFYGSCGIFMLMLLNAIISHNRMDYIISKLEVIGRVSLFVFIIQYFLYFFVLGLIRPHYFAWWPVVFVLSVIFISFIADKIHKWGWNQFITVMNLRSIFQLKKQQT